MATTTAYDGVAAQLAEMNAKLERMHLVVEDLGRRMESFDDLKEDLVPIAHGALKIAYRRLHELEREGVFEFASESATVLRTIAASFSREDVRLLGIHVVKILQTVRNLTQPEVLEVADRAAVALKMEPTDKLSLFRTLRDPDIRRGLTLLLGVLRELGSDGVRGGMAGEGGVEPGSDRSERETSIEFGD